MGTSQLPSGPPLIPRLPTHYLLPIDYLPPAQDPEGRDLGRSLIYSWPILIGQDDPDGGVPNTLDIMAKYPATETGRKHEKINTAEAGKTAV